MSLEWHIDRDRHVLIATVTGVLRLDEARANQRTLEAAAESAPGCVLFVDVRGAEVQLSSQEVLALAGSLARPVRRRGRVRSAIVVDSDLKYGLGRMYEAVTSATKYEYRTFRDEAQAWAWLFAARNAAAAAAEATRS